MTQGVREATWLLVGFVMLVGEIVTWVEGIWMNRVFALGALLVAHGGFQFARWPARTAFVLLSVLAISGVTILGDLILAPLVPLLYAAFPN